MAKKQITRISTFSYQGQDFDVLVQKDKLSYIFEINGNRYGGAVNIKGRTKLELVQNAVSLALNFIETYAAIPK